MFTTSEWSPIIGCLKELTKNREISWQARQGPKEQVIFCSIGHAEYSLGSVDEDGRPPYYVAVSERGGETDRVAMAAPKTYEPKTASLATTLSQGLMGMNSISLEIFNLYNAAQRDALGIPEKTKSLLHELESIGKPMSPDTGQKV